ncbi:ESPR-type extended signal peptide-containing protein [Veillonella sp. 20925_1_51]|uniref:ESPR-type extended signal peptide-containing protein n=1 Tax=Veillonella sp. 20925_1_51 TaxID=3003641 RepID=UPI00352DC583
MNKIFKVIWSKSKQCYIVVSEIAKNKTGKKKIVVASILAALTMTANIVTVEGAIPEGTRTDHLGLAIGTSSNSKSNQSIAIGYASSAQAPGANPENPATAVGAGANANGVGAVALGLSANATGANAVALGGGSNGGTNKTEATGTRATAISFNAKASGSDSIALGNATVASDEKAIAIGSDSKATDVGTTALGRSSAATGASATALGSLASATGTLATAVGMQASASGNESLAIGTTASATSGRSLAVGTNSKATGATAVAVGSGSGGSGPLGFAGSLNSTAGVVNTNRTVNYATTAEGDNAVALGFYANAKNSGVAVGQRALAATGGVAIGKGVLEDTGNNYAGGVVIGQDSATLGPYSLAMGFNAFASGSTSMAIGHTVSADGGFAVAMGRKVSASGTSTAIGHHATATNGGLAIGSQDNDASNDRTTASAKGAVAIGKNTKATSEDAVAIGTNAQATRLNSVALGSGSTTATGATNQGSATINGITYNFAGATGNPNMQVSVGSTGATRQIKNVAAGEVSATSTDAINGSQLYAVASAVKPLKYVSINSTATGTGSNVDNDGAQAPNSIAIGPSSTVTKQNSIAFGNNAQSLSDDSITIGRNAKAEAGPAFTTTSRAIAIGANSKVATNVTQGIAIGSGSLTDEGAVVTGDQSIAIGGNVKVDGHAAVAIGGDDARKAAGQQVSYTNTNDNEVTGTLQTAILNLTGYNLSNYKGTAASHAGVAYGTSALAGNAGVAIGTASDSMTRMNDKGQVVNNKPVTNAVAIGTGARANFDNSVAIGGGSNTDRYATKQVNAIIDGVEVKWSGGENISPGDVVSFGAKGFERQLKNVAPGEVSQTSTDAINGSQIYSLARKVTNIMNGGAGSLVNVNASGEPLTKVVTGTGTNKQEKYYRTVDVKDDGTLVTGAIAQTPKSLALVNVDEPNVNQQTQTPRTLGNVANGVNDNDAVNVSQLKAATVKYFSVNSTDAGNRDNTGATGTNAIAIGPAATATKAQSIALGNSATAGGTDSIAIGNGSVAADKVAPVAIGQGAQANGDFSVALGGGNWQFKGAQANGVGTTALGTYSKTAADTSYQTVVGFGANTTKANATAIGYNSAVSTEGGVALGANSSSSTGRTVGYNPNDGRTNTYSALTGNVIRSTTGAVAVGNGTEVTRQITGVAAGTNDTDAVNVAQLKSVNLAFVGDSGFGDVNLANNDTTKRFAVKGDSTYLTTRANGNLITVSANKKDISVTNGTATAATGMADAKNVAEAINKAVSQNAYTWNLTADNDTAGSRSTINKEGTVKFSGDKNITVARNGNTITSSLNKSIIVDSVKANNSVTTGSGSNQITLDGTTGAVTGNTFSGQSFTAGDNVLSNTTLQIGSPTNGNNVTITKDGLTSKAGTKTAKFGANGIDAGGQQITNVSSGGNVGTNAANITDVKNAVSDVTLKLDTNSKTGTVKLSESPLKVIGANGIRTDLVGTNNGSLVVGLDSNTVNATTKGIGLTGDTGSTGLKYLKDGDASFKVAGDGKLVTTKASATGVQVAVDTAKVKDLAVEAVTVSKANTSDNPITVTPTAGTNSKDYAIGIDTTKLASKTDLTYRANNDADANAQKVSLAKGLNFVNGDNTVATVAADGKVSYDLNAATKTKVDESATAVARNISLGADSGTASSQSLKDGDVAFNVKGATGDYISTNMNGNTVEVSTKRATINSDANTGAASVTGNDGLATAKNVADAINKAADAAKAGAAWNLTTNSSTTDKTSVQGGDTVDLINGDNIVITQDGTDKKKITVATKKDLTVDSVTAGNTVINTSGLTNGTTAITGSGITTDKVTVGGISIDKTDGINAGGKAISNVASGGTTDTNAANIGDVKQAVANLSQNLNITDGTNNGTVDLKNQKLNVAGANGVTATVNNQTITVGLDADTVNATTKGIGLTADTGTTGNKYLKDGDVSFAVTGDGNLVSTSATAAGVKVAVDAAKVKDLAVDAVTVSKDAQADNPITVTPTAGTNSKDYAIGIDTTKLAAKTDLTYRANNDTDANAKKVSLAKGLNFVNGTLTTASIDNDGVVKYDVNTAAITAGTDGTVTGPTTDGVATAQNVADAINAAKKASKTEITANTDEAANATTGNVILTSTTAADGHTIYDVKLNNKVTLGTGANAVTIDGTAGKATVGTAVVDGVNNTITTGGASPVTLDGATGTITGKTANIGGVTVNGTTNDITGLSNTTVTGADFATKGRAATEEQLKAVTSATALKFTGDVATNTGSINLKDDTFGIKGDGKYITTDVNGKDVNLTVSEAEIKKSAVAAVTVSTDTTDTNNPISVTPTTSADGTTKDYKVTIDGTKIANKTNLSYKANDGTAKQVSLADGLNFKNGTLTTASIDDAGVVKYDVNTAAITAGTDGTVTGPTTDGVATAQNVADAINAAKKAAKTEITANTGEAANATTGNVTLTSTTAADGHTIYDVKLNDKVTLGTGANAVTIDGTAGKITAKNAAIGGVTVDGDNSHVTGLSNTTWNGTATTGRAATEDQLKAVADTAKATTDAVNLKFSGDTNTSAGVVNLKDDTFNIVGDGKYVTTDANGKDLTVKVSEAEVKKSAVAAVTVSTDTTDANNPISVTPTTSADGTTKDYKVTIDGTKIANKTNLSYKANDGTAKQVSLADGLNFKNGTLTTASIDDAGVVKYDVNTATITAGTDGTVTGPTTDGVATAQNVADAINAAKKASKTEITANTGEAANATTGNVTLTSTTAADGHTIYDVKLNDKVTLGTGANAVTIDGTAGKATVGTAVVDGVNNTITTGGANAVSLDGAAGKATIGSSVVDGVNNTITTGGANAVSLDGAAGTVTGLTNKDWTPGVTKAVTGRAATEDQLQKVADAASSQTWNITADKAGTTGTQTGTKKNATVGKDQTVELVAGDNLTINQDERKFTYSLNKDLAGLTSVSVGDGTTETIKLDGATGKVTVKNAVIGGVTVDGDNSHVTGLSNTTWNGTATTGRAATEDQLKAVSDTAKATTDAVNLKFSGDTNTSAGVVNLKDDTFNIVGDGKYVTTDANGKDLTVKVSEAEVKKSAVSAVTVSTDTTDANNPISVTPTTSADGTTKDYKVTIDGTKIANKTNLSYKANDGTAKQVSLADGLNFKNGTLTTASIDDAGVVKYDVNTATITAGTDGTVTGPTTDGVATAQNVADAINAAKKAAKTEITANTGEAANATTGNVTLTSTTATDGHTIYDVKLNDTVTLGTGSNAVTIDGTAGKATIGSSVVDGVNNTITTGGANAVALDGVAGTVKTGTVTVTGGTTNDITGLSNTTVTSADFATKGRAATEEQLKAVGEQTWQITADKDATTSGNQTGTKKDAKVGKDDKVQLIAGENLTVNQNERDFTYSLNKDLVKMNSATFEATGGKTTVITGDSIAQTDGTKTNTSTAAGNTVADGGKSTATTADGMTVTNGADSTATTAAGTTVTNANGNTKYAADGVRINTTGKNPVSLTDAGLDNGNNVIKNVASGHVNNDDTDNTNAANIADVKKATTTVTANNGEAANATTGNVTLTSTTAADGHTIYDVKLNDTVTLGTGANAVTIDGTAGKATIGSSVVDGVNNTITTGGANAVALDGVAGTVKTGTVTVTGGTTNDITGLANTTVNSADFATKGRAATEEQLKAVGEQTWQITADKDATTSGNQTGTKKDAKVGKDDKVQLIAGENLTVNQNERDFTYSLNKDLVKMNSATFEATGGKTTVITGDSIAQTDGTKTNKSTAAGNTVADGGKSTATTADGTTVTNGADSTATTAAGTTVTNANGNTNYAADGVRINTTGKDPVSLTDAGLDNGNNVIKNVASGHVNNDDTDNTNAANIADVKKATTTVTANNGEAANATTGNVTLTSTTATDGHTIYDVKLNDTVTLGTGSNAVTIDGTAGKATIGSSVVDGVNNTITTGGANAVALDGVAGTVKTGTVTVTGGTTNDITGLSNTTVNSADFATKGRAATEEQLKAVGEQTWQITADKDATTSGNQTGTKKDAKVGKDDKVQLIAGENLTVNQNERDFTYSLNKDLVKMNSATFEATGGKTTVITGDSIAQTDGAKTNKSTAAGNTVADGGKSTATTADGTTVTNGADSTATTAAGTTVTNANGNTNYAADGVRINTTGKNPVSLTDAGLDNGNNVIKNVASGHVNNDDTDNTNAANIADVKKATTTVTANNGEAANATTGNVTLTSTTAADGHTIYDVKLNDKVTLGTGNNAVTIDGTAGKATVGTAVVDGVNNTITTGGANAVTMDGAAGTVKTGTVTVTGGTTNDITGLSNTTVNSADFATKGRAATEEQLKQVGEQTWQITADKDATTSGNQTGTKKDAKVGKDDKVQLIAGENLTVNQNERDFTYSLNKDLVKMNSATFEATGGKTTVITGDSIAQTDGTKTNRSTAAGNTVADGTKSTETTAAGQVIKDGAKTNTSTVDENTLVDGAKSNKTTVDSNVIDDGNGNVNTSNATSNTITDGTNTTEATASTVTVKDNAGNSTVITKDTITTGTGANKVTVDGTAGKVTAGSAVIDGVNNTITTGGANTVKLDGAAGTVTGLTNTAWTPGVTKAVSGRAATEDQLQQVSDAVGAGWNINSGTVAGSTGEANGSAKTKISSGEEVQLQAGNNLIIDQNGKTLAYSLNKNLKDMESAIFNATGGKTTVIKGDSIVQTDGGKTNTSNAAGNTVVDGTKSTATTAAGSTITDGAKTNTNTADKNVIDDGAGNTNTSNATSNTIADPNGNTNTATATSNTLADNAGNSNVSNATSNNLTDNAGNSNVSNATSNTLKNAAGDETKVDAKGATVKDAAGNTTNVASTGATVTNAAGDTTKVEATGTTVADAAGNKATFTKDGVTITKPGKDTVSLTGNGLDNGNNKIVNVADGTNDTDAVNVRQLDAKTKAATTELTANGGESANNTTGNIVLTKTTAPDGHIIYDNKLNDKITLGAADPTKAITVDGTNGTIKAGKDGNAVAINGTDGTIKAGDGTNAVAIDGVNGSVKVADKIALNGKDGKAAIGTVGIDGKDGIITTGGNNPVAVNGKDGVVTGLTNKTWDPNNITSGRAATEDQVQSAVANAGWDATVGTEGSGVNSTPSATPEKIRPNETLTFKAGNNMMVSHAGKTISYAVNPELTDMKSATFKDAAGNTTVTNGNGITITPGSANPNNPNAGPVSLTKDGLNNGNNQIKGVAPGSDDTDAVNIGQLKASNAKMGDAIGQVAGEVQRVGAHAAAMAALKPIQYDPLEPTQIMAGVGNYRGETAAALGLAHYTNEDTMFNVGVSVGGNHNMVNAGVTHKFGSSPEKKNIPDRYKAGPISSVYVMQDEVSSLKKENAEQKYVIADQAARLNTLEAENERQRQELAETKQGLDDLRAAVDKLLASKG